MTRPLPPEIPAATEAWDAPVQDAFDQAFVTPFPPARFANVAAFPSASAFEACLCTALDTGELYFSKGGVWRIVMLAP